MLINFNELKRRRMTPATWPSTRIQANPIKSHTIQANPSESKRRPTATNCQARANYGLLRIMLVKKTNGKLKAS